MNRTSILSSGLIRPFAGLLALLTVAVGQAQEPFGFRGNGQGRFPDAQPVTEWGADKNVVWKTELPKWSNACPALGGDRLYVCAEPYTLLCINLADGKIRWQANTDYTDVLTDPAEKAKAVEDAKKSLDLRKEIEAKGKELSQASAQLKKSAEDAGLKKQVDDLKKQSSELNNQLKALTYGSPKTHDAMGYTSPTPVTDGKRVWAVFGNGIVACYDRDGNRVWARYLEQPTADWGYCSSPVLAGDVLLVQVNTLFGLDAATGNERWKTKTRMSYGTPALGQVGGQILAFTGAGSAIRTSDGKELWSGVCGAGDNSVVCQDGILYAIHAAPKAFKLAQDPATKPEPLWTTTNKLHAGRYFAAPLIHDGYVYTINQDGYLSVLKQQTGDLVYEKKIEEFNKRTTYFSPTLVGKHIMIGCDNGVILVIEPGPEYKQVASNLLPLKYPDAVRSTAVFSGTRMYLRIANFLYCLGK